MGGISFVKLYASTEEEHLLKRWPCLPLRVDFTFPFLFTHILSLLTVLLTSKIKSRNYYKPPNYHNEPLRWHTLSKVWREGQLAAVWKKETTQGWVQGGRERGGGRKVGGWREVKGLALVRSTWNWKPLTLLPPTLVLPAHHLPVPSPILPYFPSWPFDYQALTYLSVFKTNFQQWAFVNHCHSSNPCLSIREIGFSKMELSESCFQTQLLAWKWGSIARWWLPRDYSEISQTCRNQKHLSGHLVRVEEIQNFCYRQVGCSYYGTDWNSPQHKRGAQMCVHKCIKSGESPGR